MNFFGHAWLAARARPDAAFVFGAMLPDLAAMAGLRVERVAHAAVDAGRRFHLATDAAFHRSQRFASLVLGGTRALRAAGLRTGPARAVSHVGVELLLDGWLAGRHGVPRLYDAALASGPSLVAQVALRGGADAAPLGALCARIRGAGLPPDRWCEPERLAARLARILAHRPRLALAASELAAVRAWGVGATDEVAREGPGLLAELAEER
jgi:hypothetical protein